MIWLQTPVARIWIAHERFLGNQRLVITITLIGKQLFVRSGTSRYVDKWTEIVEANSKAVYRVAVRILGDAHEAEDVSQDVFVEAFKLLHKKNISDWPGMLLRLSTLRSIDRLRRRRPISRLDDSFSCGREPDESAIARELAARLRRLIGTLPPQQAAVFSMTHLEILSREEISQRLGISMQAVSTALCKARRTLERLLTKAEKIK